MRLSVSELKNVIRQVIKESDEHGASSDLARAREVLRSSQGRGVDDPQVMQLYIALDCILSHLENQELNRSKQDHSM